MLADSGALFNTFLALKTATSGKTAFYFPDFFLEENEPRFFQEKKQVSFCKTPPQSVKWEEPLTFYEGFRSAKKQIDAGSLQKAVPYTFCYSYTPMSPSLFQHILNNLILFSKSSGAYLYGYWDEEGGILGATPELLFQKEKKRLKTAAVAGTAASKEILNTPKEQKEHRLVVEGIKKSLSPFGKVLVHTQKIVPFGPLYHLHTPIEVHLQEEPSFATLISALHPTPALGAFPKEKGSEWLLDYQTIMPRHRFGAPVGFCQGDQATAYVAIRNVQWDREKLFIGAGCGVVAESEEESEWKEVQSKLAATKKILGL